MQRSTGSTSASYRASYGSSRLSCSCTAPLTPPLEEEVATATSSAATPPPTPTSTSSTTWTTRAPPSQGASSRSRCCAGWSAWASCRLFGSTSTRGLNSWALAPTLAYSTATAASCRSVTRRALPGWWTASLLTRSLASLQGPGRRCLTQPVRV
eukprot:scaffold10376_cov66-Phaeocystis_antarctica.AAC.3